MTGLKVLTLRANDIIYDPVSQRIYASVSAFAPPDVANTIATINPRTGRVESVVPIGFEPGPLAVSDDGQFLYVGLDGEAAIQRFHIPSQTTGLWFPLGIDPKVGTLFAEDIEVLPGNPNAIAVSRKPGPLYSHLDVAIFDDGVVRPNTTNIFNRANRIEFSESADLLYGYNNLTTEFGFRRIAVTLDGVEVIDVTTGILNLSTADFLWDMEFEAGLIYADSGRVIDPESLTILGTYATSDLTSIPNALVEPDPEHDRVYFITQTSIDPWVLRTFDRDTFVPLEKWEPAGLSGDPLSLINWGNGGLAFHTSGGQVFILPEIPIDNDDLVLSFAGLGSWKWMNNNNWERLHAEEAESLATGDLDDNGRSDSIVDFGPDLGVWKWMNDAAWVKLHGRSPTLMITGDLDGLANDSQPIVPWPVPDDDPVGVSSTLEVKRDVALADVKVRVVINHSWVGDLKIVLRSPAGTEVVLLDRPGSAPGLSEFGCGDDNMEVTFDDASGFHLETHCDGTDPWYAGQAAPIESLAAFSGESSLGTWSLTVSDAEPEDTGLIVDWQLFTTPDSRIPANRDDLVASFPTLGLWRWMNDSRWLKLHNQPAEAMAVADLDGNGIDDVVIDFGATVGLWRWMNDSQWVKLHGQSPEVMATGDLDGNGLADVVIGFGQSGPVTGTWKWMNNAGWVRLHERSPELLATGDLDGNGIDDVVVDFGATIGLWRWMNDSVWIKLHHLSPELMVTGDLDKSSRDDVVVDFGSTVGLWKWMNNAGWVKLHNLSPEVMATGNLDGR